MSVSQNLETVDPSKFKKRLTNVGVRDLQTALNVLALYQAYRTGDCVLDLDDIGLHPSTISAAINYVLSYHHANVHLYECYKCTYCKDDLRCTRTTNKCRYEEEE